MPTAEEIVRANLLQMQDAKYRAFTCRLLPTVPPERVIGVRTPALRCFAKEFHRTPAAAEFLSQLPHFYYEENNVHGFLIEQLTDPGDTEAALDAFLPFVDNWATCDQMRPKAFFRHSAELLPAVRRWTASERTYTARFGMGMLMGHYLGANFEPAYPVWVADAANTEPEDYYRGMMAAWYFATALAKRWDDILPWFEGARLPEPTRRKAIQKALESFRISPEQKALLRTLRGFHK